MEKHKSCSFFGHRKIDANNYLSYVERNYAMINLLKTLFYRSLFNFKKGFFDFK